MKLLILSLCIAVVSCCSPKPPDKPKLGIRCLGPNEGPITIATGKKAPGYRFCKGDIIFEENFNALNEDTWKHEETLSGGPNKEFQWSTNDRSNSFVYNGFLYLNPTLTESSYQLTSGTIDLSNKCTNSTNDGCKRTGTPKSILNPIKSATIKTSDSFSFKYGELEIRAKMPSGDWLRPSIWLLPKDNSSNGISFVDTRGNQQLITDTAPRKNIGSKLIKSTLYYLNQTPLISYENESPYGFDDGLHTYKITWNSTFIEFSVDGFKYGTYAGAILDKEVYILLNLGVGGNNFVPNGYSYTMPWSDTDTDPTPATTFWNKKDDWLPTWKLLDNNRPSSMIVDYVKVTAL